MTPLTLSEVADRQRLRSEIAITLAAEASAGVPGPCDIGDDFWRTVARECELCYALLAGTTPEDATLLSDRVLLTLALRENTSRSEIERAALQTVIHELRMDLASWRGVAGEWPLAAVAPEPTR
jgi:hypothetical protein